MTRHRGDSGDTSLFDGTRVSKCDARIVALGDVDELNSAIGLALTFCPEGRERERLSWTQGRLFTIGAELANPGQRAQGDALSAEDVATLDAWLCEYQDGLPRLRRFVLPGGTPAAAAVHVARTVCRRAERSTFGLGAQPANGGRVSVFLNRLSEMLFEMARYLNSQAGVGDVEWLGPRERLRESGP